MQFQDLEVLYEDNHLFVLNKPAGITTQPNGLEAVSLQDVGKAWIKHHKNKPGAVFLEPLHRLDKPVSGIVVFAKTSKALSRLNESQRNKMYQKTYLAVIEGKINPLEGTLEDYLFHDDYIARVVSAHESGAKKARLHYKTLKSHPLGSLVEINLETGRYHQIRVQFATAGCPIAGDLKYGSKKKWPFAGIALHHTRIYFPHPVKSEWVEVKSPPPASFI